MHTPCSEKKLDVTALLESLPYVAVEVEDIGRVAIEEYRDNGITLLVAAAALDVSQSLGPLLGFLTHLGAYILGNEGELLIPAVEELKATGELPLDVISTIRVLDWGSHIVEELERQEDEYPKAYRQACEYFGRPIQEAVKSDKVTQEDASPDLYEQCLKEKTLFWIEAVLDDFKEAFIIYLDKSMADVEGYWREVDSIDYPRVVAEFGDYLSQSTTTVRNLCQYPPPGLNPAQLNPDELNPAQLNLT